MKHRIGLAILTHLNKLYFTNIGNYSCQLAATIVEKYGGYPAIVMEVDADSKISADTVMDIAKEQLAVEELVFGFSMLGDLDFKYYLNLSSQLRGRGYITFLAGGGSQQQYLPEVGCDLYEHRFQGNLDKFNFLLKGSAEQVIPILRSIENNRDYILFPGVVTSSDVGLISNPQAPINLGLVTEINWSNIFSLTADGFYQKPVEKGVVLGQWGCPYGARLSSFEVDPPEGLGLDKKYTVTSKGCSFCNYGNKVGGVYTLSLEHILAQISKVPRIDDKVRFYFIHQYPFSILPRIIEKSYTPIREVSLMSRADHITKNQDIVEATVRQAYRKGIILDLECVGFEGFIQKILNNLNKGTTVDENLEAIQILFDLAEKYPQTLKICSGGHGWIFPTPWHVVENLQEELAILKHNAWVNDLFDGNIHDRFLRISHTDCLGDWVRFVEQETDIKYQRGEGGMIEWYTDAAKKWPSFPYGKRRIRLSGGEVAIEIGPISDLILFNNI